MADPITPPPGTTPPPAPQSSTTPPPPQATEDWRSWIQDEAIRNHQTFTQMKETDPKEAFNSLAKQYFNQQKLIGGEKVLRPQKNWTPEQWKEWREQVLDTPKTADDYKTDLTEFKDIVDEKGLGLLKSSFLKNGLTTAQVDGVLKDYFSWAKAQYAEMDAQNTKSISDREAAIKKAWGTDYDKNREFVDYAIQRLGDDEAKAFAKANPDALNSPWLANLLVKAGRLASGDNALNIKGGEQPPAPSNLTHSVDVKRAINELRRDPIYEAIIRSGGPQNYASRKHAEGKGSADADLQRFQEINKQLTALYTRYGEIS